MQLQKSKFHLILMKSSNTKCTVNVVSLLSPFSLYFCLPIMCLPLYPPIIFPPMSQPQDLIGMIDNHYNFLDHLEEMEESSSNEDDKSSIFGITFAHKTKRSRSLLSLENETDDVYVVGGNCVHCIVVYYRRLHLVVCGRCNVHVCMVCAGMVYCILYV